MTKNFLEWHLPREVGRFEEALTAAEKAESLRHGLAEKQSDAYTADWATSLGNLGNRLSDVGRFEEALMAAEKAESLQRRLAEKQLDAYTADWAKSLGNLADSQLAVGEFANALETAKTASLQISAFAARYPPVYNPWLGFARRIAAESCFKMGRLDEAVAEARLSVQIWTEVATARQNYESTQVAKTFRALMQCEIALNQNESAIETLKRGLRLLHIPLTVNPKPLQPIISELVNLALAIDADAVARVIPNELRRVLNN
jgi:tetratricopeptide (TPR) repeat protein